jgi:uncharacterized protein YecE (DUF72 family)
MRVGCCGWGFFRPKNFFGEKWKEKFRSVLQAYAKLFSCVEVNSTFYRIPKLQTVERWKEEAKAVNENFEFTVKAFQGITHKEFFSEKSFEWYEQMKAICRALDAKILLIQTPASFKPTQENIERLSKFFKSVKRNRLVIAWEPRGKWEEKVKTICKKFNLVHCVDLFREEPQYLGKKKIAYIRLHGFGKPSMYNYKFSRRELLELKEKLYGIDAKEIYVLFNNVYMYENALEFLKIVEKSE